MFRLLHTARPEAIAFRTSSVPSTMLRMVLWGEPLVSPVLRTPRCTGEDRTSRPSATSVPPLRSGGGGPPKAVEGAQGAIGDSPAPRPAAAMRDSCPAATRNRHRQFVIARGMAFRRERVYGERLVDLNRNRRHRWNTSSASPSLFACAPGVPPDGGFGSTFFLTVSSTVPIPPEILFRAYKESHHAIRYQEQGPVRPSRSRPFR